MANNGLEKTIEAISNVTKLAVNVTDPNKNKPEKKEYRSNQTSQPHNQTVEVKVGEGIQQVPQPTIIEKKAETHIHKDFPDNRPLTDEECKVKTHIADLEDADKEKERAFKMKVLEMELAERKEQAEYERAEAERRREEARKAGKRALIIGGIFGGIALGIIGYDIYTSSRSSKTSRLALQPGKGSIVIDATDSTVE